MKSFRTPYFFRWIFFRRIWGFSRKNNTVYLTFDDGPTPECTDWILDVLSENVVKATFFCVGSNAKKHSAIMQRIIREGHRIGNHTMCHEKGIETDKERYLESVEMAAEYIDSDLFRPPYGRLPVTYAKQLRKKYQIVMWTWLSYDYHPDVGPEKILERAKKIQPGDVLVLHDNLKSFETVKEVLPQLLKQLKKRGLKFATISA